MKRIMNSTKVLSSREEGCTISRFEIIDRLRFCINLLNSDFFDPIKIAQALQASQFREDFWEEMKLKYLYLVFMAAYISTEDVRQAVCNPQFDDTTWCKMIIKIQHCQERTKGICMLLQRYHQDNFVVEGCEDPMEFLSNKVHLANLSTCALKGLSKRMIEGHFIDQVTTPHEAKQHPSI